MFRYGLLVHSPAVAERVSRKRQAWAYPPTPDDMTGLPKRTAPLTAVQLRPSILGKWRPMQFRGAAAA